MAGHPTTLKVGGPSREQDAPGDDGAWISLAVLAGGAERLDSALLDAVAPAVREARERDALLESWFFERYVDERGPQLRVHLRAPGWSEEERDALAERMRERLGRAGGDSPRRPLLPVPPSYRNGGGQMGVEAGPPPPADADGERLSHVSSESAVEALPLLEDGRERAAFALLLATALSDAALEHGDWERFWQAVARSWVGEGARGERLLERLRARADELGPELLAAAREVGRRPAVGSALGRYARACQDLAGGASEDVVARHAHLTANRLGLVPLEEALVALLLAGGVGERIEVGEAAGGAPAVGPEVLRVRGVSRDGCLDDVSFEVREGEVFGLLGRDGAGKSTLLGIAAGLRVPSAGTVEALGADPQEDRDGLGVGLPDGELADDATVRENLELRRAAAGGDAAPDAVLGELGLSDEAGTRVGELERGDRRLVAIGCALMADPRLLFLDEPTAGLSPTERERVWELVRRQGDRGRTVVLTTASLQDACAMCDRAALLEDGSLKAVAHPERVGRDHFEKRKVRFDTEAEPDRALLEDLPEVLRVRIEQLHPDHWSVEATTAQPAELMKLLGADPDFPWVVHLRAEDLE